MTTANDKIRPFRAQTPHESLDDPARPAEPGALGQRGPRPRPEGYGVSLAWVRRLTEYWRDSYDWRAAEAKLDSHPQFVTEIDSQNIHFLGKSTDPGALPLIPTHGWPGSVVEFLTVIGPLTDLRACGEDPELFEMLA